MSEEKPDIGSLVTQIKSVDPEAFHDALKDNLQDHYNKIFRTGYGVAKGEFQPKIEASTKSLEQLQSEIQQRETRIKELQEKSPDLAKLEAKWEAALQAKAEEIEKVKGDYSSQLKEKDSIVLQERRDSFSANLVRYLVEQGADKDYAEVLVSKQGTQSRIKWGDERYPKIYQEDGQTPFPQSDGKRPYEILGADLLKEVPDKFLTDRKPSDSRFGDRAGDFEGFANLSEDQQEAWLKKAWAGRL